MRKWYDDKELPGMATKITPQIIAQKMGKPVKDVIFQLQSLGADITDPQQVMEPEVIQALITGKKLVARTRSVIMRPDKAPASALQQPRTTQPIPSAPVLHQSRTTQNRSLTDIPTSTPVAPQPVAPMAEYQPSSAELLWALRQTIQRDRQQASGEIFLVHGHDGIRHAVAGFLTSLSLTPIMLDERPNRGQTIIEKLEDHAYTPFAVVLLTPDDEGRKKGDSGFQPRPRQNVVLELGYFLARLGRHRVCALYVPSVELPSDIQGLLYVELDQSGGWKYRLQNELIAGGVPVRLPS